MKIQIALEFVIMLAFITVVFIFLFDVIATQTSLVINQQSFSQLQLIAQSIAQQINIAASAGNNYYANVPIVGTIAVPVYSVNITKNGVVVVGAQLGEQVAYATAYTNARTIFGSGPLNSNTISLQNYYGAVCIDTSCPALQANAMQANLTGWWPLSQRTGSKAYDFSGNNNTGILHNVSWSYPRYTSQFNGNSAYINLGSNSILSPEAGSSGQMTLCGWIMQPSATTNGILIKGESSPSSGSTWEYQMASTSGGLSFVVWTGGGSNIANTLVTSVPTSLYIGKWAFECFTYSYPAAQAYYYFNGVQFPASFTGGTPATAGTGGLVIGVGETGYTQESIANLQMYSKALSASNIISLYQEGISGTPIPNAGNVAWWPLNGDARDYSGNGNNGIIYGGVNFTGTNLGLANANATAFSAGVFNGASSYIATPTNGLPAGSSARSVFVWINTTGNTAGEYVYAYGSSASDARSALMIFSNTVILEADGYAAFSTLTPALNQWQFVGYTYVSGSSQVTLYLNGQSQTVSLGTTLATNSLSSYIGSQLGGGSNYQGAIANLQVYNTTLSVGQELQLYSEGIGGPPVSGSGLVAWWPLAGSASDFSNKGNSGISSNVIYKSYSVQNPSLLQGSLAGAGANFNTANSYINMGTANSLGVNSLTVSAWVKVNSYDPADTNIGQVIASSYGVAGSAGYILSLDGPTAIPQIRIAGVSSGNLNVKAPTSLKPGVWSNIATTYNATANTLILYVNGVQVSSASEAGYIYTPSNALVVGEAAWALSYPQYDFNGSIANVQLYKTALSPLQIYALYRGALYSLNTNSGNKAIYTVPIKLANSQSSGTGSNFQQMLAINSLAYSSFINSGWNNVEFSTGPSASGNILQAWVESNAINTATNTIVWVDVSNGLAASSNTIIYMDMMANPVMSAQGPTGEAPQLSTVYGQYDNGASVFSFYDNFAGTSLSPKWTVSSGATSSYSVNNGITMSVTGTTVGTDYLMIFASYTLPSGGVVGETLTNTPSYANAALPFFGYSQTSSSFMVDSYEPIFQVGSAYTGDGVGKYVSGTGSRLTTAGLSSTGNSVTSFSWSGTSLSMTATGGISSSTTDSSLSYSAANQIGLYQSNAAAGQPPSTTTYWIRVRAYPPNGVMPTVTFISN